jgi:hypothetical protein
VTSVATNAGLTGGTITTSGTVGLAGTRNNNMVPKWNSTGNGSLVDSTIFDNGTFVGIGTTSPTDRLHVVGTLRTTDRVGVGVAPQSGWALRVNSGTNDGIFATGNSMGGSIHAAGAGNATNYGIFASAVGATTNWAWYSNAGDMYVSGRVAVGTTAPTAKMHVVDTSVGGTALRAVNTQSGVGISGEGAGGVRAVGAFWDFDAAGSGVYNASSSRRWKRNVATIDKALNKVLKLRGVTFDWDEKHGGRHSIGFIAEDVGQVIPEVVQYEKNGVDAMGMDYSKVTAVLVEAVKEQQAQIEALKKEIEILKGK